MSKNYKKGPRNGGVPQSGIQKKTDDINTTSAEVTAPVVDQSNSSRIQEIQEIVKPTADEKPEDQKSEAPSPTEPEQKDPEPTVQVGKKKR